MPEKQSKKNSIIIVLGNLMDKSARLNSESCFRLDLAIEIFEKKKHAFIVTSGWAYRDDCNITLADAMKDYILKNSRISSDLVITEKKSRDTVGDAIFTKINIIRKKNLTNLLVVTSDYHVLRTNKIFSFVYGESYKLKVLGIKRNEENELLDLESKSLNQFYKTFDGIRPGNDEEILSRLVKQHPYYNGDFYPKI